jgi:Na+/H+ antiporter NhaC
MEDSMNWGVMSLLPLIVALAIAFASRSAVFSLLVGCITGVVMLGSDPARGLNGLFQDALASREFIWVCMIVVLIGVLFALFRHVGVVAAFARRISVQSHSPRRIGFTAWCMGFFIIDDYFSPLITGAVMRPLTDAVKMSREKLAFILDSTTASVCVLVPFTAWGAYITSLILVQKGPVSNPGEAMSVFVHAIPYNFYSILLVIFTLGICLKLIPDFGPMRKAEHRAITTGAVLREGAMPLINTEGQNVIEDQGRGEASLIADLLVPVVCVFGIVIGSFVWLQEVLIVEAFLVAVTYLSISLLWRRRIAGIEELVRIATEGVKDVMPAIMVVALAYCINYVTQSLGAADYLVAVTARLFTPELLVAATFLLTALISFSTGTSWGAFALIMPIALPMAYAFTGGQIDPLVFKTVAAVTGGGIFGDHASPVSDTSVLSSAGAGSDHMDHVITQLPYALVVAVCTIILYLLV